MPTHAYDDILDLPHHVSERHPPMSLRGRAGQFAPFASLSGYGAAVRETARLTDEEAVLDEDSVRVIDVCLRLLHEREEEHPAVTVTYFEPDTRKDGGQYTSVSGTVRQVDEYTKTLLLDSGSRIEFRRILWIESEITAEKPGD